MRVAGIQMVSSDSLEDNLAQAQNLLTQAAAQGAELAVLPEFFCMMGLKATDKVAIAEDFNNGPIQHVLSELSRSLNIWIAAGTVPLKSPDPQKIYNSLLVFNNKGLIVSRYDKIHLFYLDYKVDKFDESEMIVPGHTPVVFESPVGQVGASICYDLRFPELYRAMGPVNLIIVPSAFTYGTGQAHWEVLLRARAIENQCYVLAPAQGGVHTNGRQTWGHTMLIDPWGKVIEQLDQGPGVVCGDLHPHVIQRVRQSLPALSHRVIAK